MLHKRGAHVALMLEEGLGCLALSVKAEGLAVEGSDCSAVLPRRLKPT